MENKEENQVENQEEILEENLSELELLQKELDAKQDSLLRVTAEYDNFRKRSVKEREATFKTAVSFTAEAMLPVYDTLSNALKQVEEDNPQRKGFELTLKQLEDAFEKVGIVPIEDGVGTAFDANLHNAVMHIDDDSLGENVIAETFQKGFMISDKVVRHSTVKVAN